MKLFKILYLYILGYVDIRVSGFFTERFVNLCFAKSIFLWKLNRISSGEIEARISQTDFKKIRKIAKNSKCKVKISSKKGIPFLLHRYKGRKIFAITFGVVAILVFGLTRFVWNIEINSDGEINKDQIMKILIKNGIEEGKLISKIDTGKTINDICMNGNNISWCGIKIKGTNVIVSLETAILKEEVFDESIPCDVIAEKDGIITKVTARNGTALVKEGDLVKQGDILISNLIEGKYTEPRNVTANGEVLAKVWVTDEKEEKLRQEYFEKTDNSYNNFRIKVNNFEINFNKRLPKFKKYDTIETNKKLKVFSNFYLPIELKKITYKEKNLKYKEYTEEELSEKLQENIKSKLLNENEINQEKILQEIPVITPIEGGIRVKLTIVYEDEIGIQKSN